jgi:PAS domain S-box-containing protein
MYWLYLLGTVTLLTIALRRLKRRQQPLDDELYSKKVAIEHVQSGVAWVRADGTFGFTNQSFAKTLKTSCYDLGGKDWYRIFSVQDRENAQEAYTQMLLSGVMSMETRGARPDGSELWLNVRLVAVHDHNMRFVGHHCLIEDRTREHELEQRVTELDAESKEAGEFQRLLIAMR